MFYEGTVYRPPSEAYSLIIQLTIGCARNNCTFCSMYKDKSFRIRPVDEVLQDFNYIKERSGQPVKRIFLADGDALIVKTADLLQVLKAAKTIFPECERITIYGAPADVLAKSVEELRSLQQAGLEMVYIGAESGDDQVLLDVQKGASAAEIIEACLRLKAAGIKVSLTLISGLGGQKRLREHAVNSAKLVSAIKPEYVGLLTLMLHEGTPLAEAIAEGSFTLLTPQEVLEETYLFLSEADSEGTVLRSNHASNYVTLAGTLNADRQRLLAQLEEARRRGSFRPEGYRGF